MKTCRDCKLEKEQKHFIRNGAFSSGYDTLCIECNRRRVKEWRIKNPDKRAAQLKREGKKDYSRSKQYRANYGITIEDYNEMFSRQHGCCAICGEHQTKHTKRLAVDHCHTTRKVRGLLCQSCNLLLGAAKDNVSILQEAIKYLK